MRCQYCDGEGIVCDECHMGEMSVRLTEHGELCQECLQNIIDSMDDDERESV